jgi:fructose-1-phosphate kinase PfkB-like protein
MRSIVDGYGPALLDALRAGVWGVKINAAEAQAATGIGVTDDAGALSAARGLRVLGAQVAVITLGARGAVALDQHGAAWRVGTPPVDGRYPVGSGDAFLAGLAVALLDGLTVAEAARAAAAAAAANAEQPGAGVLDRGRAAELIPRTEVLPLGHHT